MSIINKNNNSKINIKNIKNTKGDAIMTNSNKNVELTDNLSVEKYVRGDYIMVNTIKNINNNEDMKGDVVENVNNNNMKGNENMKGNDMEYTNIENNKKVNNELIYDEKLVKKSTRKINRIKREEIVKISKNKKTKIKEDSYFVVGEYDGKKNIVVKALTPGKPYTGLLDVDIKEKFDKFIGEKEKHYSNDILKIGDELQHDLVLKETKEIANRRSKNIDMVLSIYELDLSHRREEDEKNKAKNALANLSKDAYTLYLDSFVSANKNAYLDASSISYAMALNKDFELQLSYDTEYQVARRYKRNPQTKKYEECEIIVPVSYQFGFYYNYKYYLFLFDNFSLNKFELNTFLKYVFDYIDKNVLNLNGYDVSTKKRKNGVQFQVSLTSHNGLADHSLLKGWLKNVKGGYTTDVNGGYVAFTAKNVKLTTLDNKRFYFFGLKINDSMLWGAKSRSLASMSSNCEFGKYAPENIDYENILSWSYENREEFIRYALQDVIAVLEISKSLWGYNTRTFLTIGSFSNFLFKKSFNYQMSLMDEDYKECFYDFTYKGQVIDKQLREFSNKLRMDYKTKVDSPFWHTATHAATRSYFGGLNQCYVKGFVEGTTYDYDLVSAYPSMMSLCPMIDFSRKPLLLDNPTTYEAFCELDEHSFFNHAFALVDFDFTDVRHKKYENFPFIPQQCEGSLVFTKKGENVIVAGAELYLGLITGAIKKVHWFIKCPILEKEFGNPHYVFAQFQRYLVSQREVLASIFGKKSAEAMIMKLVSNSAYGKTGQSLSHAKYNIYNKFGCEREFMPSCDLTNAFYASFTTNLCRTTLHMIISNIEKAGYNVVSVTTDGFISDCPFGMLKEILSKDKLLCEITEKLIKIGKYLKNYDLNDPKQLEKHDNYYFLEEKHTNENGMFSIATRGNIGFDNNSSKEPVFAKMGYKGETFSSHNEFLVKLCENNFMLQDCFKKMPTLKDFYLGNTDIYSPILVTKNMKFEYDFKRLPLLSECSNKTFTVVVNGEPKTYTVVYYKTRPYDTLEDFLFNKEKTKGRKVIMTKNDLVKFFDAVEIKKANKKNNVRRMTTDKELYHLVTLFKLLRYDWYISHHKVCDKPSIPLLDKNIINFFNLFTNVGIVNFVNSIGYYDKKISYNTYINSIKSVNNIGSVPVDTKLIELLNEHINNYIIKKQPKND